MAIPTLIVGLGGTGVLTVRALKRLYARLPKAEMTPAGFLAIDFDRSATEIAKDDDLGDLLEEEFLYLRPQTIQDPLANLDRAVEGRLAWDRVHTWFPNREDVHIPLSEVESNGAGQYRALGRLGLFVHVEQIENALRKGLDNLPCETETASYTRERRVILVASVAGGTGSGMLIDVAYLVRRQPSRPRVYAYLLLPEIFAEVDQGGRIYQNAYAALRELAHFKDQQVPFQADYWQVPPIDIAVGGEEPFTRIYLFGRLLCSKGNQVIASCRNTAQTILAQLNRTIQEKTLAIVANTASSDGADEGRRRRTHCFSTAGSHTTQLGMQEITQEETLRHALMILADDERLGKIFESALDDLAERSERALDPLSRGAGGEAPADRSDAAKSKAEKEAQAEERAKKLGQRFRDSIASIATDGCDRVLAWLHSELEQAHAKSAVEFADVADRAWKAMENLYDILLKSADEERKAREGDGPNFKKSPAAEGESSSKAEESTLKAALDSFRSTVPPFREIEQSIHRRVNELLQISRDFQDPKELVLRHLFVSQLLRFIPFFILFDADRTPRNILQEQWKQLEEAREFAEKRPWWKNLFLKRQKQKLFSFGRAEVLRQAANLPELTDSLRALFLARSAAELRGRLWEELRDLQKKLEKFRGLWSLDLVDTAAMPSKKLPELPLPLRSRLAEVLQQKLARILEELREKLVPGLDEGRRRRILRQILEQEVLQDEALKAARFVMSEEAGSLEQVKKRLIGGFVSARQDIFIRRTPNPQRKGFAINLTPDGLIWPEGNRRLHRFLDTTAEQVLECRSQSTSYPGERLWLYFEDLFNPPEHIRSLDDYYHSYKTQALPELFHIDRRLLKDENFRQIHASSERLVVPCGNDGCSANIANESRILESCPKCQKRILSRCGNPDCRLDDLHRHPQWKEKTCPGCHGFNKAAWWQCERHGKQEVLVPNDKPRCPHCVMLHHEDPVAYPEEKIGRRPDTIQSLECPRCVELRRENAGYEPFLMRGDLLPFYRHGVNGHDRAAFLRIARRDKLPDDFRCPKCRTPLIPFHHRELQTERYA